MRLAAAIILTVTSASALAEPPTHAYGYAEDLRPTPNVTLNPTEPPVWIEYRHGGSTRSERRGIWRGA